MVTQYPLSEVLDVGGQAKGSGNTLLRQLHIVVLDGLDARPR